MQNHFVHAWASYLRTCDPVVTWALVAALSERVVMTRAVQVQTAPVSVEAKRHICAIGQAGHFPLITWSHTAA